MATTSKLAAPELAGIEVHGMTRSAFIVRGALAAGAVYGAGVVAPFVAIKAIDLIVRGLQLA